MLQILSLCKSSKNKITAKGIKDLVKNEWPQLHELFLGALFNIVDFNNIGNEGFDILIKR